MPPRPATASIRCSAKVDPTGRSGMIGVFGASERIAGVPVPRRLRKGLAPRAEQLDRTVGWPRLPYPLGLATLVGLRERLRERNLYRTPVPAATRQDFEEAPRWRAARSPDGRFNDPHEPHMGAVNAPFGRNATALP